MTKNFILSRNPELFIKSTERDYAEMISGTVTEAEAYEYVSNLLPLARACNNNKSCWFWLVDEAENMPSDIRVVYMFEPAVVNGRFCPQSVRSFCPVVAGFNAGTYKVPACVL
ncbi:MAG: hypothetical protein SPF36_06250 [Lachnospiraceae bacterium]|nr:hypothetical protein [Lachnospiraceae bacterium]